MYLLFIVLPIACVLSGWLVGFITGCDYIDNRYPKFGLSLLIAMSVVVIAIGLSMAALPQDMLPQSSIQSEISE